MDRAALDKLYNNRAAVPGHLEDMARWSAASLQTRQSISARLDLRYGPHPREVLDLFTVPQAGRPLLVFIHGGYWQALGKDDFSFTAEGFAGKAAGHIANVAVLNYPLSPDAIMDGIVASIRRALKWLWREAASLGIDHNRIYVSGHSAGGHLTVMAALTDWPVLEPGLPADLVKAGLSLSGLYDLRPIQRCYLNDKLGMDEAMAERNSPLLLLPQWQGSLPPLTFAVGELETAAFHGQQHDFVKAYAASGGRVTAITAPGKHHFSIVDELARPGSAVQAAIAGLLH